jgi:diaminopimelate epimerase
MLVEFTKMNGAGNDFVLIVIEPEKLSLLKGLQVE